MKQTNWYNRLAKGRCRISISGSLEPGWTVGCIAFCIRSGCNKLHAEKLRTSKLDAGDLDDRIGGDSAREIEAKLTLEAVRQFIWKLPEEQRTVLLLVVVEGASYKEASDLLGIPIGTVTSRLARARTAIREFVDMTAA